MSKHEQLDGGQGEASPDAPAAGYGYRRKQRVIRAVQWTGENLAEVRAVLGTEGIDEEYYTVGEQAEPSGALLLTTVDGERVRCLRGHWVMSEPVPDRYYPCAPQVFEANYERVQA